jgi:hypothetical protein
MDDGFGKGLGTGGNRHGELLSELLKSEGDPPE